MKFYKYQATGNDFIFVDAFDAPDFRLTREQIAFLCDRHFGIGADGLIILRPSDQADFFMDYYNADGSLATFCGNGARATVLFAYDRQRAGAKVRFEARDGLHSAFLDGKVIRLEMKKVRKIRQYDQLYFLNTGTEHAVKFVQNVDDIDVLNQGKTIRFDSRFAPHGTNVNFVQIMQDGNLNVRTYEKGVEAETLSCGTGTVAVALVANWVHSLESPITVYTRGGQLTVYFQKIFQRYVDIWLEGPAQYVFSGEIFMPFKEIEKNQ